MFAEFAEVGIASDVAVAEDIPDLHAGGVVPHDAFDEADLRVGVPLLWIGEILSGTAFFRPTTDGIFVNGPARSSQANEPVAMQSGR